MKSKKEVLAEIVNLARSHNISNDEIITALQHQAATKASREMDQKHKVDFTMKLFSYLGGIFILAGISIYISTFWSQLNSPARIIITLGTGLVFYIIAIAMEKDPKYRNMITPLYL